MNEIELSDKILKDLYEKDKLNGAGIYNIDEIAAKYGITDFHRTQRIVKIWDSDGFVKECCSKDANNAEITFEGIKYIEQKSFEKDNTDMIQEEMNIENKNYKYDVALSFAGEQREYVEQVAKYLKENGIKYFYDKENKAEQWGKNLTEHFGDLYSNKAEFCIMFISKEYKERMWPTHERRSALDRAIRSKKEYILPVKFDDTKIDGLYTSTGYLDAKKTTPKEVVEIFLEKIGRPLKRTHKHKEFSNIPIIKKFEIIPNKVKKGERAVYYWEVKNVDQNIIIENHHSKGSTGEHIFGKNYKGYYTIDNIQDSITFTLNIENNLGKDSKTIELELVNDPEVSLSRGKKDSQNLVLFQTIGSPGTGNGQFRFGGGLDKNGGIFIRDGVLYVTDWSNKRLQIFKFGKNNLWNYFDSMGGSEQFCSPIFVDKEKNIFIHALNKIYKFDSEKKLGLTIFADINNFRRFTLDKFGNLFVQSGSDTNILKKYDLDGKLILEFGGFGESDGKFDNEGWTEDVVADKSGNIYILDVGGKRVQKFDNNGIFLKKWNVEISGYSYMAVDEFNKIYVVENGYTELNVYDTEGNITKKYLIPNGVVFGGGSHIFVRDNQLFVSNCEKHHIKVFNFKDDFFSNDTDLNSQKNLEENKLFSYCYLIPYFKLKEKKINGWIGLHYPGKILLKDVKIQVCRNLERKGEFLALEDIEFKRLYPNSGAHLGSLQFEYEIEDIEFQISIFQDNGILNQRIKIFKKGNNVFAESEYYFYNLEHKLIKGNYFLYNSENEELKNIQITKRKGWKIVLSCDSFTL